ncbi:MAG: holo-ACP synthase [Deltaproteobacteria bacterium]|nr:holo-ACP synthase [Deltaproteobacteria bacterium]
MTIIGIGSDLVKISRIETLLERYREHFSERVFTAREIAYASPKKRPALHLAARFAAKEAFLKALGRGLGAGLEWRDIEVVNNAFGRPELKLYNEADRFCRELKRAIPWLSLTHEQEFALAFVVLEKTGSRT